MFNKTRGDPAGKSLSVLKGDAGWSLNDFRYPYSEADGKPLNEDLYGFNIGYTIRYREF